MAPAPIPIPVVYGTQPYFLLLPLRLFAFLLLYYSSFAIATLDLPFPHPKSKSILSYTPLSYIQTPLSEKNLSFSPKNCINPSVSQDRRSVLVWRLGHDRSRSREEAGFSRPMKGCSRLLLTLNHLQVCATTILRSKNQIFSPDLLISHSNPPFSRKNLSGGYLNPCYLMNVRQNLLSFIYYFTSPMAAINFEEELRFRESDSLEIEDEPSPPDLRPLGPLTTNQIVSITKGSTKGNTNSKGTASSKGKRTSSDASSKDLEIPKPKHGRPPAGATKNV